MFEKTQENLACDLCDEELNQKKTSSLFHCQECNNIKSQWNKITKKMGCNCRVG
ncbi:hypothetical protein HN385_02150 [archaeon]|mgnify:CR=1 FL=1|jgi:hypothetical protein|nr:hypothetical protein [archaeon]MBT3450356.1 hypothetical protein [archaeon]MBT6868869.1 hypothetical protein [archaeon]MBT7192910.1 hypothetical protein [archaeon]MBT7380876.1 hypothetical protein [archaeon]